MGVYASWVLPRLIHWTMRHGDLTRYRERLIPLAHGRVLEIGIGSGLNLPFYREGVVQVIGVDPARELLRRASAVPTRMPVHLVRARAEALPLSDGSVDSIVMTWSLCSVANAPAALSEMRRVLRPDGELIFVEHGLAPDPSVANWQHRLDPVWHQISCHLNHPVDRLLEEAGFEVRSLTAGYLGSGPKSLTYMYEGFARARTTPGSPQHSP